MFTRFESNRGVRPGNQDCVSRSFFSRLRSKYPDLPLKTPTATSTKGYIFAEDAKSLNVYNSVKKIYSKMQFYDYVYMYIFHYLFEFIQICTLFPIFINHKFVNLFLCKCKSLLLLQYRLDDELLLLFIFHFWCASQQVCQ